jgi:hypothetical protein
MVDIVLLAASFTLELCHQQQRKLTRMDHKPNLFRVTKHSGLGLEKQPRSSARGGAFFLTSLFIELTDRLPAGAINSLFLRGAEAPLFHVAFVIRGRREG